MFFWLKQLFTLMEIWLKESYLMIGSFRHFDIQGTRQDSIPTGAYISLSKHCTQKFTWDDSFNLTLFMHFFIYTCCHPWMSNQHWIIYSTCLLWQMKCSEHLDRFVLELSRLKVIFKFCVCFSTGKVILFIFNHWYVIENKPWLTLQINRKTSLLLNNFDVQDYKGFF